MGARLFQVVFISVFVGFILLFVIPNTTEKVVKEIKNDNDKVISWGLVISFVIFIIVVGFIFFGFE